MRLDANSVITDHALFYGVGSDDHHVSAVSFKVLLNSLSIAPGAYSYRVSLGKSSCRSVQGIIRGHLNVDIQGHCGVFFLGAAAVQNSSAVGIRPYPSGVQSYVGGYSRLHSDNYLSHTSFGASIRLNDVYIDGSDVVFVFENISSVNQNLKVYGAGLGK